MSFYFSYIYMYIYAHILFFKFPCKTGVILECKSTRAEIFPAMFAAESTVFRIVSGTYY